MNKYSLSAIVATNKTASSLAQNPVGVFIGGTNGVGLHTAYAFAKYTPEPTIYLIGRDSKAADEAIKEIGSLNSSAKAYFLKHDLTLIKEGDKLVEEIKAKESKINLLCLTTGFLKFGPRRETVEGLDEKMAVNYYVRWNIIDQLVGLVQNAADLKEPARVVNVFSAGTEGKMLTDDLDLKKNFTMKTCNIHTTTSTSLQTQRFPKLYPDITFIHDYPGFIRTKILRDLPWYVRYSSALLLPIMESPEACGERQFYAGYSGKEFKKGGFILGASLNDISPKVQKFLSPELADTVWAFSKQRFEDARKASS